MNNLTVARLIRIVFGVLAGAMLLAALADVMVMGHLTIVTPVSFGALLIIALAFLIHNLLVSRERHALLMRQATEQKNAALRLETSLRNAAAMNARLYQSELRYKGLVDAQGDAIFRRDASSRLTYANEGFFQMFGLDPARTIGYPFAPELHPESRAPLFGSFAALEAGRGRARYDQHVRTALGYRWIAWEDYAVRDSYGRLVEVQSVGRDVTERKALEDALTEARDSAEAASRAKSGFLATMSHEIRTPMNGVVGMIQVLESTELSPAQRRQLEVIRGSSDLLLRVIDDLLDFSKIEAGKFNLDAAPLRVDRLVRDTIAALSPAAAARGIELLLQPMAPELAHAVNGDATRLRQILTNLVHNAIKFTASGGSVRVGVTVQPKEEARHFVFAVCDTGMGIDAAKLRRIFEPFEQADRSTTRKYGGTGLGLAIVKGLIDMMGGRIDVESEPGKGSRFTVELLLPAAEPAPDAAVPASMRTDFAKLRVLVAEDNPTNQIVATAQLNVLGIDQVSIATNGREAVTAALRSPFDLILMDIHMPEMDGYEATDTLRRSGVTTPIVAMTANVLPADLAAYTAAGMIDCLAKPMDLAQLRQLIQSRCQADPLATVA